VKKDKIIHNATHWDIRIDGVTKGTTAWAEHPDCSISDSTMRKRCRNYNPDKHTVHWVVFGQKARSGNPLHAKTIEAQERRTDYDQFELERNLVAISSIWSPRLSESVRYRKMAAMVRGE